MIQLHFDSDTPRRCNIKMLSIIFQRMRKTPPGPRRNMLIDVLIIYANSIEIQTSQ